MTAPGMYRSGVRIGVFGGYLRKGCGPETAALGFVYVHSACARRFGGNYNYAQLFGDVIISAVCIVDVAVVGPGSEYSSSNTALGVVVRPIDGDLHNNIVLPAAKIFSKILSYNKPCNWRVPYETTVYQTRVCTL
jgi:hypothetical protein